ncbi:MAG: Gfo/Idh/MocA family oxidoreductase [Theionarchaea archaeon]|nr:Gfo/Idh/MocA family oxidoreductase [Theionarchaea archaeon]
MKILVIGAGSIGRRHINNLNLLGYTNIDVVDTDKSRLAYVKKTFDIAHTAHDFKGLTYDAAFVLTPPAYHMEMALELAKKGTDLFIEKPLSHSLTGVDELIQYKEDMHIVIMVGYNLRFHFGLQELRSRLEKTVGKMYYIRAEMGQYLPDWRPWQDYRKNYTAVEELGGGILLDGSHEIDYMLWLVNDTLKDVKTIYDRISNLEISVEDIAEVILQFENGIIGSIHLDMIERGYNRYCKVIGEKGTMKWIFKDNILELYDGESRTLTSTKYEYDHNHSYVEELKHFFSCVETRSEPVSNVYTAKKTLETVMRIKGDSNEGQGHV